MASTVFSHRLPLFHPVSLLQPSGVTLVVKVAETLFAQIRTHATLTSPNSWWLVERVPTDHFDVERGQYCCLPYTSWGTRNIHMKPRIYTPKWRGSTCTLWAVIQR